MIYEIELSTGKRFWAAKPVTDHGDHGGWRDVATVPDSMTARSDYGYRDVAEAALAAGETRRAYINPQHIASIQEVPPRSVRDKRAR